MKNLILIAGLFTILASCKNDEAIVASDYFAFGTSYGMCSGNCATFFLVKDNNVYPDDMTQYTENLKFKNTPLSAEKYKLTRQLLNEFPQYLKDNPNKTYGCPDCHDQGAIHIELKENGHVKSWHIDMDMDQQPNEIKSYIQDLKMILGQL